MSFRHATGLTRCRTAAAAVRRGGLLLQLQLRLLQLRCHRLHSRVQQLKLLELHPTHTPAQCMLQMKWSTP